MLLPQPRVQRAQVLPARLFLWRTRRSRRTLRHYWHAVGNAAAMWSVPDRGPRLDTARFVETLVASASVMTIMLSCAVRYIYIIVHVIDSIVILFNNVQLLQFDNTSHYPSGESLDVTQSI